MYVVIVTGKLNIITFEKFSVISIILQFRLLVSGRSFLRGGREGERDRDVLFNEGISW
jgi:hypothetical protein